MKGAGWYNYEKAGAKDAMVTLCVMNLVEKYRSQTNHTARNIGTQPLGTDQLGLQDLRGRHRQQARGY